MDPFALEQLAALYEREGEQLFLDPRRFANLLRDVIPQYRREANVLSVAVQAGIPAGWPGCQPACRSPYS